MPDEEELDKEIGDALGDEETPENEGDEKPEGEEEQPKPDARIEAMQRQIEALSKGSGTEDKIGQLLELGKSFLEKQSQPSTERTPADKERLAAFGKMFQDAVLSDDPEKAGLVFAQAINQVSSENATRIIEQRGGPVAERVGQYAVSAFLSAKRDEVGANGEKLHKLVARDFTLTPQEKVYLATATAEQTHDFLEGKYERGAGKILIKSAGRARPRDISSGGGKGGENVLQFPGLSKKQVGDMETLTRLLYPGADEKTIREKMKKTADQMRTASGE